MPIPVSRTSRIAQPASVRNAPEKLFVLRFRELMPPTLLTLDVREIHEFWRTHGLDYRKFEEDTGLGLPVVEAKMRYRQAARFDDLLTIETWVSEASRASIWYDARITREKETIHESSIRLACVSFAKGALQKIPDVVLDASLEKGWDV